MAEKTHWPFGSEVGGHGGHGLGRSLERENKRAHAAELAALRQRMRYDRLIVGGRAHTKKSGLS